MERERLRIDKLASMICQIVYVVIEYELALFTG